MPFVIAKQLYMPLIVVGSYAVFLLGFFPIKQSLSGFSEREVIRFRDLEFIQPNQSFSKIVIVLIDALRTDFVYDRHHMPFVKSKLSEGFGRNFTLRAHPPTVTLPRIKALTTGSIPGFIDIVLNFDSSKLSEDNIISQAYRKNKRIVFYGDDTWIKLFPNHFSYSDGTTSFFVTDYTEVDDNVTRHIDTRLSALDWDLMILHYLGLDHIGHTVGPNSPLVVTKLSEMDDIVNKIYSSLEKKGKDFVMLICGDHGMSDQGSHGGASDREVFVPAVFISPKFRKTGTRWKSSRELLQIDLGPTLSMLMGIPIPMNNLGQGLVDLLEGYSDTEKLVLLYMNCQQVLKLMERNVPDFITERSFDFYKHAIQLHESYITENFTEKPDISMVIRAYETAMDAMATKISKSLTTYDLYSMIMALLILLISFASVLAQSIHSKLKWTSEVWLMCFLLVLAGFTHVTVCTSQSCSSSTLCGRSIYSIGMTLTLWTTLMFLVLNVVQSFHRIRISLNMGQFSGLKFLLVFGTFIHSVSFVSSSFVEEEHQTWYLLSMTLYILLLIKTVTTVALNTHRQEVKSSSGFTASEIGINQAEEDTERKKIQSKDLFDKKGDISETQVNDTSYNGYYLRDRAKKKEQILSYDERHLKPVISQKVTSDLGIKKSWKKVFPWQQELSIIAVMCIGRLLRSINQTGNKWLNLPDVGDWLVRPENAGILSYLSVASLLTIMLIKSCRTDCVKTILLLAGLTGCYCYRISTGTIQNILYLPGYTKLSKGITEAQIVYAMMFLLITYAIIKVAWHSRCINSDNIDEKIKSWLVTVEILQLAWILLMILILRPHNTIFVAMVTLQEWLLWKYIFSVLPLPVWCQALICWWLGQTAFFQQGNSNSISTVDASAGFVGLQEYQTVLAGILLYCSTYTGPVFWFGTLVKSVLLQNHSIHEEDNQNNTDTQNNVSKSMRSSITECIQTLTIERVFTLCIYCTVVTIERYHLFVWTVFSPKLLYEGMLTITYVLFTVILGVIYLFV